jgi:pimeloyl-[acyl-carrier protein] synthase
VTAQLDTHTRLTSSASTRLATARGWAITSAVLTFVATSRVRTNPHAAYRLLRRIDRAHRSPIGLWVLSGHDDIAAALRHPDLGSDESKADLSLLRPASLLRVAAPVRGGPFRDLVPNLILFRDPPDHTRLRSLVNKAFTPRAVSTLEERVTRLVHERLDQLAPRGHMELLSEFAYPVPALVICELLGAPASDQTVISRHAPPLAARLDPNLFRGAAVSAAADQAVVELTGYLTGLIGERRRHPGPDLLSALIAAQDGGDRLSHDELVTMAILLLIAGHETTANLLGNGILALLRNPDQLERVRQDPSVDHTTVEELLRYDGPIQMVQRVTLDDVEIGTNRIPKGHIVAMCIAGANRDPAVFHQPDRLDVTRTPNPHLAFGAGAHFCVGAPLARMEARIALRALLDRLPDLRLTETKVRWRPSFTIRGLRQLPIEWRN